MYTKHELSDEIGSLVQISAIAIAVLSCGGGYAGAEGSDEAVGASEAAITSGALPDRWLIAYPNNNWIASGRVGQTSLLGTMNGQHWAIEDYAWSSRVLTLSNVGTTSVSVGYNVARYCDNTFASLYEDVAYTVVAPGQTFSHTFACPDNEAPTSSSFSQTSAPIFLDSCAHPICQTGGMLTASCDQCVAAICAADSYCCQNKWDAICVGEVSSVCTPKCSSWYPWGCSGQPLGTVCRCTVSCL